MAERQTGIVKWFNNSKGYGFIESDEGQDVFVHHNNIEMQGYRTLKEGQIVTFHIEYGDKGMCAVKVTAL